MKGTCLFRITNPHFGSCDDKIVPNWRCLRLQCKCIGARSCLGQTETANLKQTIDER